MSVKGTERTKAFYDEEGWRTTDDGLTVDRDLFGVKEDGPLRRAMFERGWQRVQEVLNSGPTSDILEVGCGGAPARALLPHCSSFTGVDFSPTGLEIAREELSAYDISFNLVEADAVNLPFKDNSFDTVYSAHMIYHIEDRAAQQAAVAEMLRVVRPGGWVIVHTVNPRPVVFPVRFAARMVAELPVLSGIARRLKGPSPIPYNPPKLGWYRRQMRDAADLRIITGGIPSTGFNQTVSEYAGMGKLIWQVFNWLDKTAPRLSAYLGNYAVILAQK